MGLAMNIDEYVPDKIPAINGSVKSLMDSTPKIYKQIIATIVVKEVLMDLFMV
jgi:hypothetical protein